MLILLPLSVNAAEISLKTRIDQISVGGTFSVNVSLDTQNASINAVSGSLAFSSNLRLLGIRLESSLVPLWITSPVENKQGTVSFAGILPGGYKTRVSDIKNSTEGNIFTLVFKAASSGTSRVVFSSQTAVYLNDGKGTRSKLTKPSLAFKINKSKTTQQNSDISVDKTTPNSFTPIITSGKPFGYSGNILVFVAQDKGSGILGYEIARSYFKNPDLSSLLWSSVKSPYKLLASDGDKFLFIRAIDNSNNIRVSVVAPQHTSVYFILHKQWVLELLTAVSGVLFISIILILRKRNR